MSSPGGCTELETPALPTELFLKVVDAVPGSWRRTLLNVALAGRVCYDVVLPRLLREMDFSYDAFNRTRAENFLADSPLTASKFAHIKRLSLRLFADPDLETRLLARCVGNLEYLTMSPTEEGQLQLVLGPGSRGPCLRKIDFIVRSLRSIGVTSPSIDESVLDTMSVPPGVRTMKMSARDARCVSLLQLFERHAALDSWDYSNIWHATHLDLRSLPSLTKKLRSTAVTIFDLPELLALAPKALKDLWLYLGSADVDLRLLLSPLRLERLALVGITTRSLLSGLPDGLKMLELNFPRPTLDEAEYAAVGAVLQAARLESFAVTVPAPRAEAVTREEKERAFWRAMPGARMLT
ncbi:hypothetical protein DFJ74DRAFT_319682 [Hyaloraphidium curvatum]|nr:hypothetical protein DFJ74DRAFT_319682 [Hyaloraphidium curvatum]